MSVSLFFVVVVGQLAMSRVGWLGFLVSGFTFMWHLDIYGYAHGFRAEGRRFFKKAHCHCRIFIDNQKFIQNPKKCRMLLGLGLEGEWRMQLGLIKINQMPLSEVHNTVGDSLAQTQTQTQTQAIVIVLIADS
jgi:hypothetical protein